MLSSMEMAEVAVCGRKKCRSGDWRTRWWSKEVEAEVRRKMLAYKRWLQLKSRSKREVAKELQGMKLERQKNDEWRKLGE